MGKLRDIKGFIQQVADAFAAVLDYEICIISDELEVVSGTGEYQEGKNLRGGPGCITHQLLLNPHQTDLFVKDTKDSVLCNQCSNQQECPVQATIVCSIISSNVTLGTFCLMAINEKQYQNLIANNEKLMTFSRKVADFIASTLGEKKVRNQMTVMANQFESVINSIDEGIITIDAQGKITHINQSARKVLGIGQKELGKQINDLFSDFDLDKIFDKDYDHIGDYFETKIEYITEDKKLNLLCNMNLIESKNEVTGATISFRKLDEMKRLANKLVAEDEESAFAVIKGTSNSIVSIKKKAARVASTDSTILLRGESGTGKGMFAQAIHEKSNRGDGPFITVNCAAIPESLLESELFGYEKGAFTGAKEEGKPGKFELADKGTIFLDEIGDMPFSAQVKLLKVIENKQIKPIGAVKPVDIDVRIIAATHRDLEKMVTEGDFREDLFYRLNVIPIHIPPLRERKEDISLLLHFFLKKYTELLNKKIKGFTERAKKELLSYSWPGNVRELENSIEYAVNIETSNYVRVDSLPKRIVDQEFQIEKGISELPTINEVERQLINKAMDKFGTDGQGKRKAAKALGIGLTTLYRRLEKYDINISH